VHTADWTIEQKMSRKERSTVDSGTQQGIHVPVGDLVRTMLTVKLKPTQLRNRR
jgi:hypothetical protein